LKECQLELCEAKKALGSFQEAESLLVHKEQSTQALKRRQAVQRVQAENQLVIKAEKTRQLNERLIKANAITYINIILYRELSATAYEYELQTRALLEQAKLSQEKGKQFLQETIVKRKKEEAVMEEQHRAHLDKRIKAMISLKNNIESSQV